MELNEKEEKKIKSYRKSLKKEPIVKRCLLILDLKPFRSSVKRKHSIDMGFQSLAERVKKVFQNIKHNCEDAKSCKNNFSLYITLLAFD